MGQKRVLACDLPPILLERSPGVAILNLIATWGLIAGIAAAAVFFDHVAVWAAAIVGIAIMQHRLTKLGHHSLHSDFSRSTAFNELIGRWFLLAPLMAPFSAVRYNHLGHHRNLGKENDYERVYHDLTL